MLCGAEIPIAFGSDLLGDMRKHQSQGLRIQAQAYSPADVICSATRTCASLFQMDGLIGEIAQGCFAGTPFMLLRLTWAYIQCAGIVLTVCLLLLLPSALLPPHSARKVAWINLCMSVLPDA